MLLTPVFNSNSLGLGLLPNLSFDFGALISLAIYMLMLFELIPYKFAVSLPTWLLLTISMLLIAPVWKKRPSL